MPGCTLQELLTVLVINCTPQANPGHFGSGIDASGEPDRCRVGKAIAVTLIHGAIHGCHVVYKIAAILLQQPFQVSRALSSSCTSI
jgi:hypothetical protein